mgnify:CR=1 FL=1
MLAVVEAHLSLELARTEKLSTHQHRVANERFCFNTVSWNQRTSCYYYVHMVSVSEPMTCDANLRPYLVQDNVLKLIQLNVLAQRLTGTKFSLHESNESI